MALSLAPRSWSEGRYGEWDYGGKPLVPPTGGGTRKPMPISLTNVPNIPVTSLHPLVTMPTRVPAVVPRSPGVVMPSRVPEVRA